MSLWLCFHVWQIHHLSSLLDSFLELNVDEWGSPGRPHMSDTQAWGTHLLGLLPLARELPRVTDVEGARASLGRAGERLNPGHHPSCLWLLMSWPGALRSYTLESRDLPNSGDSCPQKWTLMDRLIWPAYFCELGMSQKEFRRPFPSA